MGVNSAAVLCESPVLSDTGHSGVEHGASEETFARMGVRMVRCRPELHSRCHERPSTTAAVIDITYGACRRKTRQMFPSRRASVKELRQRAATRAFAFTSLPAPWSSTQPSSTGATEQRVDRRARLDACG